MPKYSMTTTMTTMRRRRRRRRRRRKEGRGARLVQFFQWTKENTYYLLSAEKSLGMGGGE